MHAHTSKKEKEKKVIEDYLFRFLRIISNKKGLNYEKRSKGLSWCRSLEISSEVTKRKSSNNYSNNKSSRSSSKPNKNLRIHSNYIHKHNHSRILISMAKIETKNSNKNQMNINKLKNQ